MRLVLALAMLLAVPLGVTTSSAHPTQHLRAPGDETANVTVFGARWCGPCHVLQDGLKERGIPYDYIDIDDNPAAWEMARKASGSRGIPTTSIKRGPSITWVIGSDVNAVERAYKGE